MKANTPPLNLKGRCGGTGGNPTGKNGGKNGRAGAPGLHGAAQAIWMQALPGGVQMPQLALQQT
jgi:hypothetical protein